MRFTILGGSGFIGSHLTNYLRESGEDCFVPGRDDRSVFEQELGHVIYCVGLTSDFRHRPFDTVRAHVGFLADILEKSDFESLLFLSSTRVYWRAQNTDEDAPLVVDPGEPDDLYNLSKITGESLCCASGRRNVRIARLSNVIGGGVWSDDFLGSLIEDAVVRGRIILRTSLDSAKDYVAISDVVRLLPQIASAGANRLYNVASGTNLTNRDLVEALSRICGCPVLVSANAPAMRFPQIQIRRIREEFGFNATDALQFVEKLVRDRTLRSG